MGKINIGNIDHFIENQILLWGNRTLKVRTWLHTGKVDYIVKTKRGKYIVQSIEKAIEEFNDPEN